jgi:hypothetical protein
MGETAKKLESPQAPPDLHDVNKDKDPDGSFFDIESLRRTTFDKEVFGAEEVKHAVKVIMGSAEAILREGNPALYDKQFEKRYERTLGSRLQFRASGDQSFRLTLDEEGNRIETPIADTEKPDIDDFIMDAYDRLEASDSPVLHILDTVRDKRILDGNEYVATMRLCIIMAAQDLPPSAQ